MNRDHKRKIAYEVLIFLSTLGLLALVTRMWPVLLLIILGIFIAALRLLFLSTVRVEIIEPIPLPTPVPGPETEKDLLRRAYGLIERRITEDVTAIHPSARWHWLNANAIASIERDEPVAIILNGAGGYKRASVQIHNLLFRGLVYEAVPNALAIEPLESSSSESDTDDDNLPDSSMDEDQPTDLGALETLNYEYMAFEWVDARLLMLNDRSNEAIGKGQRTLLIPSSELPAVDSWQSICKQLIHNDFSDAVVHDDGILVSLQQ